MMRHVHTSKAALHTSVVYIAHAGAVFATVLIMPEMSSSKKRTEAGTGIARA